MKKTDLKKMIQEAQRLQQEMERQQETLDEIEVEGSSGGGMVIVSANGNQKLTTVKMSKEAVESGDIEMLEDLILSAVNNALQKAEEAAKEKMGKIDLGGLELSQFFK